MELVTVEVDRRGAEEMREAETRLQGVIAGFVFGALRAKGLITAEEADAFADGPEYAEVVKGMGDAYFQLVLRTLKAQGLIKVTDEGNILPFKPRPSEDPAPEG